MASIRAVLRHILLWSYERGTIQYDIICALILAFIFFVPKTCFVSRKPDTTQSTIKQSQVSTHPKNLNANEKRR